MGKKVVFLDRDGVINKLVERNGKQVSPRTSDEFKLNDGAAIAITTLRDVGFEIIVVTNQPDISRGLMKVNALNAMHEQVYSLGVTGIHYCPHSDEDNCDCRKPKAGLLHRQLRAYKEAPNQVWMIGDSETDVICGTLVGARTIRISEGEQIETLAEYVAESLEQAASYILSADASFDTVVG